MWQPEVQKCTILLEKLLGLTQTCMLTMSAHASVCVCVCVCVGGGGGDVD